MPLILLQYFDLLRNSELVGSANLPFVKIWQVVKKTIVVVEFDVRLLISAYGFDVFVIALEDFALPAFNMCQHNIQPFVVR